MGSLPSPGPVANSTGYNVTAANPALPPCVSRLVEKADAMQSSVNRPCQRTPALFLDPPLALRLCTVDDELRSSLLANSPRQSSCRSPLVLVDYAFPRSHELYWSTPVVVRGGARRARPSADVRRVLQVRPRSQRDGQRLVVPAGLRA